MLNIAFWHLIPKLNDLVLASHVEKAQTVFDFNHILIGAAGIRDSSIDVQQLTLTKYMIGYLDIPFWEEVWAAIKEMPFNKAPNPDGFTG